MQESIHKYFQVGTLTWMSFPKLTALEAVKRVADDSYFDAIELKACADEAERLAVKEILEQSHLTVYYGAQPTILGRKLNPNAIDEDKRKEAEQALLEAVDEAAFLGAKGLSFLAGKWEEETKEQGFLQLLKTTKNLCEYAGEKGLMVELELFDYDMDKGSLMGPAPYGAEFAARVRESCHNFGLLADLSHFPTTYETSDFVVRTLKPYLTHLHFGNAVVKKDCPAYGDKHPRFGFPESANDTAELLDFLQVLKREGFFRPENPLALSMEVTPYGMEEADFVLASTKRVLNRAWALL